VSAPAPGEGQKGGGDRGPYIAGLLAGARRSQSPSQARSGSLAQRSGLSGGCPSSPVAGKGSGVGPLKERPASPSLTSAVRFPPGTFSSSIRKRL
jgi:hypothetical protein